MVKLAVPGAIMTLSEWAGFEILTFATSYAGAVALAAQTLLATSAVMVWHVPFACSMVSSTRLGQIIRGGYVETAKKVSSYFISMFMMVGCVDISIMFGLPEIVIQYLAIEKEVRIGVISAMPFAVVFTFFDCMATCLHGIIRGSGWQSIGGWTTVLTNYLYGLPLAVVLELDPPHLGLRGLWMAMASCMVLLVIVEGLVLRARSWNKLVEEARRRQET